MSELFQVRRAGLADVDALVELSAQVQRALEAAGSLQQFGPLARDLVATKIEAGAFFVLEKDAELVGAVCVERVTRADLPLMAEWGLDETRPIWYLSKLMVAPGWRGFGLSGLLIDAAKQQAATTPDGLLILDCWAGNEKLRELYTAAGFTLHGVFPEEDWQIALFSWSV